MTDPNVAEVLQLLVLEIKNLQKEIKKLQSEKPEALATVEEASLRLGVSISTIRRQIKSGALPSTMVGRCLRVDLSKVQTHDKADIEALAASLTYRR